MKRITRIAALLSAVIMLFALLAGCASKAQSESADTSAKKETAAEAAPSEPAASDAEEKKEEEPQEQQTPAEETAPAAEGAHIVPMASSFDPMNLEDCVFPVSFTNDDIELNDEGTLILHLTVWEQELFDMVDISMLKEGDTITVHGEDVSVDTLERAENIVHINGGAENGGITLAPSEYGGTFYESIAEVSEYDTVYTAVAQLALPVDADNFIYTDNSDPEGEAQTYYPGDLLTMKDSVDFSCTALNATAHIVNNQVAEIVRVYMP